MDYNLQSAERGERERERERRGEGTAKRGCELPRGVVRNGSEEGGQVSAQGVEEAEEEELGDGEGEREAWRVSLK